MASQAAAAILAGIPAMQNAAQMRANTGAIYGEGIANVGKQIGGILQAQSQKKVEDDYATVDNAFQSAIAAGKPEEMTRVLTAIAPILKTPKGKAYLAEKMGKTFGIRSDMLDIEAKKLKLEREKKAPARAGIINRAFKGDKTALDEAAAMGDEDLVKEAGGAFRTAEASARAEEASKVALAKEAEAKRIKTAARMATSQVTALHMVSPFIGTPGWTFKVREAMNKMGGDFADPSVQEQALVNLKIDLGEINQDEKVKTAQDKARETARFRQLKAQGLVEVTDPETGEVSIKPDVTSERFRITQEANKKKEAARAARLAKIDAREEDAANAKDRNESWAHLSKAVSATKTALSGLVDQDGDPVDPADEEEVRSLKDRLINYAQQFPEKANEIMGSQGGQGSDTPKGDGSIEPPPEGPDEYDENAARAAGARPGPDGHWVLPNGRGADQFKTGWNSRRIMEFNGRLVDTMNDRPATEADLRDAIQQAGTHGRKDTVDYLVRLGKKWFPK